MTSNGLEIPMFTTIGYWKGEGIGMWPVVLTTLPAIIQVELNSKVANEDAINPNDALK